MTQVEGRSRKAFWGRNYEVEKGSLTNRGTEQLVPEGCKISPAGTVLWGRGHGAGWVPRPHFTGCSGELCCGGGIPPGLVRAPMDSEWGRGYLKGTLAAVSDWRRKSKAREREGGWSCGVQWEKTGG